MVQPNMHASQRYANRLLNFYQSPSNSGACNWRIDGGHEARGDFHRCTNTFFISVHELLTAVRNSRRYLCHRAAFCFFSPFFNFFKLFSQRSRLGNVIIVIVVIFNSPFSFFLTFRTRLKWRVCITKRFHIFNILYAENFAY